MTAKCYARQIGLELAVERVGTRAEPGEATIVRQMHAEFARSHEYATHVIEIGTRAVEEVAAELRRRLDAGHFRLDLDRVRHSAG